MRHLYTEVVSYNRFVELEREIAILLMVFIKKVLLGKCTGISFVDSTPLRVCKNQRIRIHKTFKGIAQRGKCSMDWFFGFKLHLICNEKGELKAYLWRKIGALTMTVMVGIYAFVPAGTGLKGGFPLLFWGEPCFSRCFFAAFAKFLRNMLAVPSDNLNFALQFKAGSINWLEMILRLNLSGFSTLKREFSELNDR